jgi:predicted nucleic acid-binding protein
VKTADTSVIVAAFATWHESHAAALAAVTAGVKLIGHVALECYSVLTRLPPPYRVAPAPVNRYLRESFDADWLQVPVGDLRELLQLLAESEFGGGAVYDGLIGRTAANHETPLLSLDRRARAVYELCGADVEIPH